MIKKEIAEIKRQFSPERCSISRICGCYVDGEKNKKAEFKEAFLSLPEEDMFKYFELLRKNLSGTLGKNLINLEFPLAAEEEGGPHEFLLKLRNSRLQDDALLDAFYDRIIENYDYVGNYLILLIHDAYDIPGKTSDGIEMEDASDEVYRYIMCCICPVELSKAGLSFDEQAGEFQNRIRDWVVGMPDTAFLFPAFNDRSADVHSALMYAKKDIPEEFVKEILGTAVPLSSDYQKTGFSDLIESTLGTGSTSTVIKGIHESLMELVAENMDNPEVKMLNKEEIFDVFQNNSESVNRDEFDAIYEHLFGDEDLVLSNLVGNGILNIDLPGISVKARDGYTGDVEVKMIDGRKCLVIGISGEIEVNGTKCER